MTLLPTYSEFCPSDIENSNLFHPFREIEERKRNDVKVLEVSDYAVYTTALHKLLDDWLKGKIGSGPPTESWEIDAIRKVNGLNNKNQVVDDIKTTDEIKVVYDHLVELKVPSHFRIVTSHRHWIRGTLKILKTVGVDISDNLDNLVWRHDLSKYSHKEVLGYAIMFGDGRVDFRKLQKEEEKFEWENTLFNHYAHNPHHPEYFYPLQEDGTRKRDKSVTELDPENGQDYLDESIVDMLAANGERLLADDPVIDVRKWFGLADRFFMRYSADDAEYVRAKIMQWSLKLRDYLADGGNGDKLRGILDKRRVTYKQYENET